MMTKRPICFTIMPFGKKRIDRYEYDFDQMYADLIAPAAESAGYEVERADSKHKGALISSNMIRSIMEADIVIADITYQNPNVFYEVGLRHALAPHGTVLVKRARGNDARKRVGVWANSGPNLHAIPFDIQNVRVFEYEFSRTSLENEIERLRQAILSSARSTQVDSPVFESIPELRIQKSMAPALGIQDLSYEVKGSRGAKIGFRSGNILNLKGDRQADYWVSSENTLMQMARMYERSVSSTIRYHGASDPNPVSPTYEDTIADALKSGLGNRHCVDEGDVLMTTAGRLRESHGVQAILHAATVTGAPGEGWRPVSDIALLRAIEKAIQLASHHISKNKIEKPLNSIVMPLFGTGQGKGNAMSVAGKLIYSAMDAMKRTNLQDNQSKGQLNRVYFLAFTQVQVDMMKRILDAAIEDGDLMPEFSQ